jgi:uncharacterized protein YbbK (DUF523 family)
LHHILVSSCLLGMPVRYDGAHKAIAHRLMEIWQAEGRLVSICPEMAGGLPTPRPAAELQAGRVRDSRGNDVTDAFERGAQAALQLAQKQQCVFALLKENSPSCGSGFIGDGSFSGTRIAGAGLTARLLRAHGIAVYSELQIEDLAADIAKSEHAPGN